MTRTDTAIWAALLGSLAAFVPGCFDDHAVEPDGGGVDGGRADGGGTDGGEPDGDVDAGAHVTCVRLANVPDLGRCCLEERPLGGTGSCEALGTNWHPGRCSDYPVCPVSEPCESLPLDACISAAGCVPVFDNACCPSCGMVGPCADCTDWRFERCVSQEVACDPAADFCWSPIDGACEGRAPDCRGVAPTSERSCAVPGCIVQQSPPCDDCIPTRTCVPHRGLDSCQAVCLEVPVDCGEGWVPEASGGCFTGSCIPEEACVDPRGV